MPRSVVERTPSSVKEKYHQKVLSDDAIYLAWIRNISIAPLFAEYLWLQLSVFDLSELGLGLLYDILPVDFEPYAVDYDYVLPTPDETLQGIWAKFEPVDFARLYMWMTDYREYIIENIKEELQPDIIIGRLEKAVYGQTRYAGGIYDPILIREFLRATFHRLRLMRTPDQMWKRMVEHIADYLAMIGVTDDNVFNRVMVLFSAQMQSFVLGLGILGRSRLSEMEGEYAKIPFMDARGNVHDVKFRTLDHLQMGFILGITPLGFGLLLPKNSIYKLPEGKKNPSIIKVMVDKIVGIKNRLSLSTFSYSNYNKPEEMVDRHRSDRANQYDLLQAQRRFIEGWVYARIPPEEANPVRIRQYQNAVLQCVSWKAKRHRWGFQSWKYMTEDQFRDWWIDYWVAQGLSIKTLESLYEGMKIWLKRLRESKLNLGERVKQVRKRLALSV